MMWLFFVFVFAASPALTAVVKQDNAQCGISEFRCGDGTCISFDFTCDGLRQCSDGSDEEFCDRSSNGLSVHIDQLNRSKRQTSKCRKNQRPCRDGSCIRFDGICDGVADCPDGSDETYPLCRHMECQSNLFRCTYGACVDGTARCNGIQECVDNSDELDPKCRNTTDVIQGKFKCKDGQLIRATDRCDGVANCVDGSDETVAACAGASCASHLFQCAYGACVDQGSDCNGKTDCADGSDESDELCNRIGPVTPTPSPTIKPSPTGACILPPRPKHGNYIVAGVPNPSPGQAFDVIQVNVTCDTGYKVLGSSDVLCFQGIWSGELPECSRFCKVNVHPSVTYHCLLNGVGEVGHRECKDYEPVGTVIKPECRTPNYYFQGVLKYMRCVEDGSWDYNAICKPECGRVTPEGVPELIDGRNANKGELPWHAGIYRKLEKPYLQICGGSLITTTSVLSAAHCFWGNNNKLLPVTNYAVAVGKLYRPWTDSHDEGAQQSDVKDIKVPDRYGGVTANYQDDIALVIVVTPFVYMFFVRPVCLDFNYNFDTSQLQHGNLGKVAGWGLTAENGQASPVLKVVELPYIDINKCIAESPPSFREYITSDKICAGYNNGTALCKGDSGGGLAFPETVFNVERYYLRGIVSTAPQNENLCNAHVYTTFTQVIRHVHFINQYVSLET